MKKTLFLFTLILFSLITIQYKSPIFSDNGYRYLTIDRFSKEGDWSVKFSNYRSKTWDTEYFSKKKIDYIPSNKWLKWIKANNKDKEYSNKHILPPTTYNKEFFDSTNDGTILAVRGEWDIPNVNWLYIYPSTSRTSFEYYTGIKDIINLHYSKNELYDDQNYIVMPSKILNLKVFVWSMGYPYKIEAHFDDYLGNNYIIKGNNDLGFLGWQEITFDIPKYITQKASSVPTVRPLKFLGFKVISSFKDPNKGFYFYIDHLRSKTVIDDEEFLGHQLKKEHIYWNREEVLKAKDNNTNPVNPANK